MRVQLIITDQQNNGRVVPVNVSVFRIGRAEDCHLRSPSALMSQQHCVIHTLDGTVSVMDLGSENGTFVNGERILSQRKLEDGDKLIVGNHSFAVSIRAGTTSSASNQSKATNRSRAIELETLSAVRSLAGRSSAIIEQENETLFEIHYRGQDVFVSKTRLFEMAQNGTLLPDDIIKVAGKKVFADSISGIEFSNVSAATLAASDRKRRSIKTVVAVLAVLGVLGVSWVWAIPLLMPEGKNPYGAVRIAGTVTLDGNIVEGVSVVFHPCDWTVGYVAGGMTDREGNFTVTTGAAPVGTGAVPGEYDVTFHKVQMEGAHLSAEEFRKAFGIRQPNKVFVIPQIYEDPKTSGIPPIRVDTSGSNTFNFTLSSGIQDNGSRNDSTETVASSYRSSFPNIFEAAGRGQVRDVEYFVRNGANINVRNNFGNTPLHFAARLNPNAAVVRYLVSLPGININARNREGETPFDATNREENKRVLFDAGGRKGREL